MQKLLEVMKHCVMIASILTLLLIRDADCQYYMYNPNAASDNLSDPNSISRTYSNTLYAGKRHYGQPIPSSSGFEDPADAWEMTEEERESKRQNPLPYIINPAIRRGTQSLGNLEAHANRDPRRKAILMPILNLVLNPSRKRK